LGDGFDEVLAQGGLGDGAVVVGFSAGCCCAADQRGHLGGGGVDHHCGLGPDRCLVHEVRVGSAGGAAEVVTAVVRVLNRRVVLPRLVVTVVDRPVVTVVGRLVAGVVVRVVVGVVGRFGGGGCFEVVVGGGVDVVVGVRRLVGGVVARFGGGRVVGWGGRFVADGGWVRVLGAWEEAVQGDVGAELVGAARVAVAAVTGRRTRQTGLHRGRVDSVLVKDQQSAAVAVGDHPDGAFVVGALVAVVAGGRGPAGGFAPAFLLEVGQQVRAGPSEDRGFGGAEIIEVVQD
jgi:hypothetical protein